MTNNFKNGFIKYGLDNGHIKPPKKEKNPAHDWPTYIEQAIKTGLESPTPYKVIPYKNGIRIKKIEFIKPKKTVEKMDGFEKIDHLINRQLLEDQL